MPDLNTDDAFRELIARGLIAAQPAPRALAMGNTDRKDRAARSSWCVALPAGGRAKLTLGHDLGDLASRHAAFANACPAIATTQVFFTRLPAGDALAEAYFDGPNLETARQDSVIPPAVISRGVARLCRCLAATEQASDEAARQGEWQEWSRRLLALPVWQAVERNLLENKLLPSLYAQLASDPPVTRWTNGDFLPANILLDAGGESRLIDTEFAARTHFFAEDAVRWRVLSAATLDRPELAADLPPAPGLSWHLYFWLRQFQLEIEHNTPEYVARNKSARLGLIRCLGEQVLRSEFAGWSTAALATENRVEDIRWSSDSERAVVITGWCCPPPATNLRGVVAVGSDGRQLDTARPTARLDVQQHFSGEPRALSSGFSLRLSPQAFDAPVTLCAVIDQGTLLPFQVLTAGDLPRGALRWEEYPAWAAQNDPDPAAPAMAGAASGPLFSILLPVYRTPDACLHDCVNSVLAQHYPRWELCVVDDGSDSPNLTASLKRLAATDPRIRVKIRPENGGISRATNDALAMAQGEYIILLDHDDLLRPHALAEFAAELGRRPGLDAIYSDEDKITDDGRRIMPFFKPDFSPEFLRGVMYPGHALGVRTTVARAAGGFDPAYDGVQDFEFFLRVTELTRQIGHIPRILYHWRQSVTSSALHGNVKGNMDERQAAAVQAHLQRIGDSRLAVATGGHRVRLKATTFPTHELIWADDQTDPLTRLREAAQSSQAEVLLLLTHGIGLEDKPWLQELVALAALPDSGCVAPLLLSADGRVHESGRIGQRPVMSGFHADSDGYGGSLRCNREVDAVSPICVAVRRSLLLDWPEAFAEDWPAFCAQLRARGLYHRVCAGARVQLKDTRTTEAIARITDAPGTREFYNPNFDPLQGDYTLAPLSPWPTPVAGLRLQFNIDQPHEWSSLPRCLIILGWGFAAAGESIQAVRFKANDLTIDGVTGLSRPDVKAAKPEAPDDNTGFEIRGTLPSGRIRLRLEARLADGIWHELMTRTVEVKRQILPLWLGGGEWMELMFFQMPAHMAYPARPVVAESFPAPAGLPRPKFSIVTPSYNHARFLPETMRGVLEQAGVECDYVVQDGGSADGSVALIERYAAEQGAGSRGKEKRETQNGGMRTEASGRRTVAGSEGNLAPCSLLPAPANAPRAFAWESAADAGQADAIAKGFTKTSGGPDDIMAWINSDDYYLPGALGCVADYFARHPDVDALYGHRIVVNEESREIARWFLPKHDPEVLRLNDFVPQETLFWRRRIWDQVGGIDPAFKFALDWDLLLRFQAAGAKIVRVPWFLACFRVHAAQKTSARMHDVGQKEITRLRERTHGRPFPPQELEQNPRLLRYLRRSAFIGFLWKLGLRAR
jgi:glycosyltransferase involved in cell wall biosynthesis